MREFKKREKVINGESKENESNGTKKPNIPIDVMNTKIITAMNKYVFSARLTSLFCQF